MKLNLGCVKDIKPQSGGRIKGANIPYRGIDVNRG